MDDDLTPDQRNIRNSLLQPLVPIPGLGDNTIRLGIVLNGTVSSGAWTAGALDALIEVADAWADAKARGEHVPMHRVRIDLMGGASGGAVCAALFARVAGRRFRHGDPGTAPRDNPFWNVWVETLAIGSMLDTDAIENGKEAASSGLSGTAIERAIDQILAWDSGRRIDRPWINDPLHVVMTQTNLRGVPYEMTYRSNPTAPAASPRKSQFVSHADHVHFAVNHATRPSSRIRPDEFSVPSDFVAGDTDWRRLAVNARASAAFPGGFPPVRLERPVAHYDWRFAITPGGGSRPPEARPLVPRWPTPIDDGSYVYDAVDGGVLNNGPFALVREGLAGLGGSLPRDPMSARAAVVVIDPFASVATIKPPEAAPDLVAVLGGMVDGMKQQARLSTSDLLLALDPMVGSRYLFTAARKGKTKDYWGGDALATSGVGAFIGFMARDLRVHDYLLGRRNMIGWLTNHFTLPAGNPVFQGFRDLPGRSSFVVGGEVPIIPVVEHLRLGVGTPVPKWPDLTFDEGQLQRMFTGRLSSVIAGLMGGVGCRRLVANVGASRLSAMLVRAIVKGAAELRERA